VAADAERREQALVGEAAELPAERPVQREGRQVRGGVVVAERGPRGVDGRGVEDGSGGSRPAGAST
jgi:hypothetical protein